MFHKRWGRDARAAVFVSFALGAFSIAWADEPGSVAATGDREQQAAASPPTVTLALTGEPVVDLLRDLSQGQPPRLSAAPVLGERRVNVFVRELPDTKLRQALADVVSGVWTRRERGAALHLEPDPAAVWERDVVIAARKTRFFQGLRSLIRDLSLDEEGRKRLEKTEPTSAGYLNNPASRVAIQLAALLTRPQWQELEASGRVTLTTEQLGPQGQSMLREYAQLVNEWQAETRRNIPDDPVPPDPPLDVEQVSQRPLQFWVDGPRMGPQSAPYSHLHVMIGDWPPSHLGARSASMVVTGSQSMNMPQVRWAGEGRAATETTAADSQVALSFKKPPSSWGEVLRAFHEGLKLQIVSEEITRQFPGFLQLGPRGQLTGSLPQILDRVCEAYGYQWRLKDGVYQFRSAAWYVAREQEPPGTLVKAAQIAREQGKPLSLDWLAAAARTAGPGPSNLLWVHAPAAMPVMMQHQPLLQFYGSLSSQQRAALESERGLPGEALSDGQRALLLQSVQRLARGEPVRPGPQPQVRLARGAASAAFTIQLGERTMDATIRLPGAQPTGGLTGFGPGPPPAPAR